MTEARRSFERLAAAHLGCLLNVAVRLAGNPEDGLGLMQETLVRAYGLYLREPRPEVFRPWLLKTLFEVYTTWAGEPGSDEPGWFESADGCDRDTGAFGIDGADAEHEIAVDAALESLPPQSRMMIMLCDVEGFSYSQISWMLACDRSMVPAAVCEARRQFRLRLREQIRRRLSVENGNR